jgi:hypothetical protein
LDKICEGFFPKIIKACSLLWVYFTISPFYYFTPLISMFWTHRCYNGT